MFPSAQKVIGISLLVLGSLPIAVSAQPCAQPDLSSNIQHVKTVQAELLTYKLTAEMDEDVPSTLQAKILAFKDSLAELANDALSCAATNVDTKGIEAMLAQKLDANKPEVQETYDPDKPPQLDRIYGGDIKVKITRPERIPDLLLVEFNFGIECGFDSVLLAFEQRQGHWAQTLRWQSPAYNEISGAFGDFFSYAVLPKTGKSRWSLAVAHGQPWCTSGWSGFKIDVLQPGSGNPAPSVIFHTEAGYKRDLDTTFKPTKNGFQLRTIDSSLDFDVFSHPVIYRYSVQDNKVQRVQPVADNGRDFVDVWLQVSWSEAARWSAPRNLAQLQQTHDKLAADNRVEGKETYSNTFGPVRSCTDIPAHYQIQLGSKWLGDGGKSRPGQTIYFQIKQGANSFTMLDASLTANPHCSGRNIMPKR